MPWFMISSSAMAWTPQEKSDERMRRRDKDPAARPERTRTRCAGSSLRTLLEQ